MSSNRTLRNVRLRPREAFSLLVLGSSCYDLYRRRYRPSSSTDRIAVLWAATGDQTLPTCVRTLRSPLPKSAKKVYALEGDVQTSNMRTYPSRTWYQRVRGPCNMYPLTSALVLMILASLEFGGRTCSSVVHEHSCSPFRSSSRPPRADGISRLTSAGRHTPARLGEAFSIVTASTHPLMAGS